MAAISFSFIHTTRLSSVTQNVNDWVSKKRVRPCEKYGIAENKKTKWNEARQVHEAKRGHRRGRRDVKCGSAVAFLVGNLLQCTQWTCHVFIGFVALPSAGRMCVCVGGCICTCSCRMLTSRNSRKFNHTQLARTRQPSSSSLLPIDPPGSHPSIQGSGPSEHTVLTRTQIRIDWLFANVCLYNHVEYLVGHWCRRTQHPFFMAPPGSCPRLVLMKFIIKILKSREWKRKLCNTSAAKMLTDRNNCFAACQQQKIFITPKRLPCFDSMSACCWLGGKKKEEEGIKKTTKNEEKNELTLTTTAPTFCCTWCTCSTSGNWWFSRSRATIKRAACQQNANNQSISINQGGSGRAVPTTTTTTICCCCSGCGCNCCPPGELGHASTWTATLPCLICRGNWNPQTEN